MKKIFISAAFLACSLGAVAQQDNTDQLQQQPPRETQLEVERAASRDSKQKDEEQRRKEAEERKEAITNDSIERAKNSSKDKPKKK